MNGIICIYKEKGMTSFDVVAAVRRIYNTKRVGHGGTLDPMAEGVLPVFVGSATKAADFCPDDTKQYLAGFQFGITTDTQDITGKVLSTCDDYVSRNKMPMVERVFSGEQLQTPPMYSAVKVNGQRLYDLARKGEVISRQPRRITIYEIKVTNYGYNCGEMSVTCSKGTYIRTLIHDIGQKLGTGAVMTSLVRTRSGVFKLEDCHRLSELEGKSEQELESLLMPLEKLYGQLPKAHLDEKQTKLFRNGAELDADRILFDTIYDKGYYIEGSDGVFLGLGKIGEKHQLEVMRRFNTEAAAAIEQAAKEQSYTPPPPVSEAEVAREVPFVPKPKKPKTDQSAEAVKTNNDLHREISETKESEAESPRDISAEKTEAAEVLEQENAVLDQQEAARTEEAVSEEISAVSIEQSVEQDTKESLEEAAPQETSIEETEVFKQMNAILDEQESAQAEDIVSEEISEVSTEQSVEQDAREVPEEAAPQEILTEETEVSEQENAVLDQQESAQAENIVSEEISAASNEQNVEQETKESLEEAVPQEIPSEETEVSGQENTVLDEQETAQPTEASLEETDTANTEQGLKENAIDEDYLAYLENALDFSDE